MRPTSLFGSAIDRSPQSLAKGLACRAGGLHRDYEHGIGAVQHLVRRGSRWKVVDDVQWRSSLAEERVGAGCVCLCHLRTRTLCSSSNAARCQVNEREGGRSCTIDIRPPILENWVSIIELV